MNKSLRSRRLRCRAKLLRALREFFHERGFVEVETPLLTDEIIPEAHIEPYCVVDDRSMDDGDARRWLQASPELHMKRLVSEGFEAIFQVTRSFRRDELGRLHLPEFTIVEWYRVGDDLAAGMDLLDNLCRQLLQAPAAVRTSYREAFERRLAVNPHTASANELAAKAAEFGVAMPEAPAAEAKDEWLN
ncbi:MAG: amino acid--tRNA ligase-related protein, partial [Planctomycetota bacterium]